MEMVVQRIESGELSLTTQDLFRAMHFEAMIEREDRMAIRGQREAEAEAKQYGSALSRLFRALLDVGGEALAHQVVVATRRDGGFDGILDLPPMIDALKWHRQYVNSARFDDRQPQATSDSESRRNNKRAA